MHLDTVMIPGNGGLGVSHDGAVEHQRGAILVLTNGGLRCEGGSHAIHLPTDSERRFDVVPCLSYQVYTSEAGLLY